MPKPLQQFGGVASLGLLVLLERFVYYGFRSIMVLYFVSTEGFNWKGDDALSFYSNTAMAFALAALPMGFLADKLFGLRRSLGIGLLLMALGYSVFLADDRLIIPAIILAIIGSGLFRPSSVAILGNLFSARSAGRDIGFLGYWLAINIGAGVSSLAVGLLAEEFGFTYGFGLVAAAAIFAFLISKAFAFPSHEDSVLPFSASLRAGSVLLVIFASIVFWGFYDIALSLMHQSAAYQGNVVLFGESLSAKYLINLSSGLTIPALLLTGVIWYSFNFKSSFLKIALGFALCAGAYFLFDFYNLLRPQGQYLSKIAQVVGMLALAEVAIAPMVYSVLTKNAARNWTATIIGLFYASTYAANRFFNYLLEQDEEIKELSFFGYIILALSILVVAWYFISRYTVKKASDLD